MKEAKLLALLGVLCFIAGCDTNLSTIKDRVLGTSKPKATATPTPPQTTAQSAAQPPAKTLIEGSIFLDLQDREGADALSGVKVQLLDGTEFEKRFELTKKTILCRSLCKEIYKIDHTMQTRALEAKADQEKMKEKEEELKQCVTVGWSEFVYVDPFTGDSIKGDFKDGTTVPMMERNIGKFKAIINDIHQSINVLREKKKKHLAEIKKLDPSMNSDTSYLQLFDREARLIQKLGLDKAVEFKCSQDLMDTLDRSTVDTIYADNKGNFIFKVGHDNKKYMCYASYRSKIKKKPRSKTEDKGGSGEDKRDSIREEESPEVYSWILPVAQDADGYRKVMLSDKNSIDNEKWNEALRVDNMNQTLLSWLRSFE